MRPRVLGALAVAIAAVLAALAAVWLDVPPWLVACALAIGAMLLLWWSRRRRPNGIRSGASVPEQNPVGRTDHTD